MICLIVLASVTLSNSNFDVILFPSASLSCFVLFLWSLDTDLTSWLYFTFMLRVNFTELFIILLDFLFTINFSIHQSLLLLIIFQIKISSFVSTSFCSLLSDISGYLSSNLWSLELFEVSFWMYANEVKLLTGCLY